MLPAPGQTAFDGEAGTNSPFTRALLANIAQPGIEIQQAMTSSLVDGGGIGLGRQLFSMMQEASR